MPLFNERADVLSGGGGELGALNGAYFPFDSYGSGSFLTADQILVPVRSADGALALWRPTERLPTIIEPARGANATAAGGGRYLAFLNASDWSGVYGNVVLPGGVTAQRGAALPDAGRGSSVIRCASRDGWIAYVADYQSGRGLVIVGPDGSSTTLPDVVASNVQVLPGGAVIWDGGAHGRAVPRPARANAQSIRLATVDGVDWITYWSDGLGQVAQIDGDTHGWLLDARPLVFNVDVVALDGAFLLCWSTTSGERPTDIVVCDVTVSSVVYRRQAVDVTPAVATWIDLTDAHDLPPVVLPDRPLWVGCFEFQQSPQGPGNIVVAVRNISGHMTRVQIVKAETAAVISGTIAGQFIEGHTVEEIEALAAKARRRPIPYWDANVWPRWPVVPAGSWICVRAYQPVGQSLEDFEVAVGHQIDHAPEGYDVALVGQAYTQSEPPPSPLTKNLAPLQRVLLRIASTHKRVRALLLFSGFGRDGGLEDHPDELAFWTDVATKIEQPPIESLTWPVDPPKPDPPKPDPVKPFFKRREVTPMEIDGKVVVLRSFKGFLIRPDAPGTGLWKTLDGKPSQWRGVLRDGVDVHDTRFHHRAKKGDDGRYVYTNIEHNCISGSDAGPFTPSIDLQHYYKPTNNVDAGDLERYCTYEGNKNGAIQALIEQKTDKDHPAGEGHDIETAPFTVEVVQ